MDTGNTVVKILIDEDGDVTGNTKWCLVQDNVGNDAPRTVCSGEVFGLGQSSAEFKTKKGKVTCPNCIATIKWFKSIKL